MKVRITNEGGIRWYKKGEIYEVLETEKAEIAYSVFSTDRGVKTII